MATATEPPLTAILTLDGLLEYLGGVSPSRVRLHPLPGQATEANLIEANACPGLICELIDGILVEKGMSYVESMLAGALLALLRSFVIPRNLGIVTGADAMMRLFPGLIRVPDVGFASWARIPGGKVPTEEIAGFAPDLAVEVLSPSNTPGEMARKRREYIEAGVLLVWEVDPRARTVTVFEAVDQSRVLFGSMILDGGVVLEGFSLPIETLFGELDRSVAPG